MGAMSPLLVPRARRAAAFIRAAMVALVASMALATTADAVIVRDKSGKYVILPPAPAPEYTRKTAEEMASDCGARAGDPSRGGYTNRELTGAGLELAMVATQNRQSGVAQDERFSSADQEYESLNAAMGEIERCMFDNDMNRRAVHALDSCEALQKEVERTDYAASRLYRRDALTASQWIHALEQLLPGAQACRNKLGRCFNPNNKSQEKGLMALIQLQIALKMSSGRKAVLSLKMPTCTKTMRKAGLQNPDPNDRPELEYINMVEGDEFVSIGGETR